MAVFFTPWISFPAVFTLGGVGVSLLWQAILLRKRSKWVFLAVLIVVFIISFLPLWCLVLRHQKTQELHDYWRSYYGDMSSPVALLFWVLRSLVVIGNYGSNGLGIPLVLLAICGAMLLWRKSPLRMLLLVSPVIFAIIGGVLRFYPIADRLVFFLEPCMWLLASNAIGEAMDATWERRAPAWLATAARAAGAFLLIPGTADVVKETAVTTSRMEFREAFVYAREHELPGDIYWVSHPQVFEVYYGGAKQSLGSYIPAADILNLAQGKRLWLIFAIAPSGQHSPATSVEEQLESAGMNLLNERHLHGVSLRLYGPHIISK